MFKKDLLELVRIGGCHGQILRQVQMNPDVVHAQVIITQMPKSPPEPD